VAGITGSHANIEDYLKAKLVLKIADSFFDNGSRCFNLVPAGYLFSAKGLDTLPFSAINAMTHK
jgi:hypothetical protein